MPFKKAAAYFANPQDGSVTIQKYADQNKSRIATSYWAFPFSQILWMEDQGNAIERTS